MITIYASKLTERLQYIVSFLIGDIIGSEFNLTDSIEEAKAISTPLINYSNHTIEGAFCIRPSGLLEQSGISNVDPQLTKTKEQHIIFPNNGGHIPFDIFSAAFYLVTRYEEYDSNYTDRQGRALSEKSISYDAGWLESPIVDQWALALQEELNRFFPRMINVSPPKFRFVSTIDIDHPYCYRAKSLLLHVVKTGIDVVKLRFADVTRRLKTLLLLQEDPFFTFDYICKLHKKHNLDPIFFVHLGPYGRYDRKTIYPLPRYYLKLREMSRSFKIGSHPSYKASFDHKKTQEEIEKLSRIIGSKTEINRQHYLRFEMPHTYRHLLEMGIKQDYSMGYAPRFGFRAGTCHPHYFFDIEKEAVTPLLVHPTILMDATLNKYMKFTPDVAREVIFEMIDECRAVNGQFVLLWHNSSLSDADGWSGWDALYQQVLAYGTATPQR